MAAPTPTEIRAYLEGYGIDTTVLSDAWITARETSFVIPIVKRITRQNFNGIVTDTEYYSGTGSSILALRRRPIVDLIAISYTNVPSEQFFISPLAIQVIAAEGILKARANFMEANYVPIFARGDKNLRVIYSYGFADYPDDIKEAIMALTAEKCLGFVGSRTGGGSLQVQGVGRNYGNRGKYTDIRNELAIMGMGLLKPYQAAVTG